MYSTSVFTELGLFNIFCFPNILYEACLDYESKIFQVSFEHVSYAPLSFEYFSLIENEKQYRSSVVLTLRHLLTLYHLPQAVDLFLLSCSCSTCIFSILFIVLNIFLQPPLILGFYFTYMNLLVSHHFLYSSLFTCLPFFFGLNKSL